MYTLDITDAAEQDLDRITDYPAGEARCPGESGVSPKATWQPRPGEVDCWAGRTAAIDLVRRTDVPVRRNT